MTDPVTAFAFFSLWFIGSPGGPNALLCEYSSYEKCIQAKDFVREQTKYDSHRFFCVPQER